MLLIQAWTLTYDFYFYLVFFILMFFFSERTSHRLLLLWGIVIVALKLWTGLPVSALAQVLISPTVLEFLAGCLLFHLYRRSHLPRAVGIGLFAASLLFFSGVLFTTDAASITSYPWPRPLLYGTSATLFLFSLVEMERTGLIRFHSALETLGDWTYSIYLTHIFVLELTGLLVHRLLPASPRRSIFLIDLIAIPAILLTGWLSYTWLEQPLKRLLYKLAPTQSLPPAGVLPT